MLTTKQVRELNLKPGDQLIITESTIGCDENDVERIHPPGSSATVDTVEELPGPQGFAVHVVIGDGERAIINTFDEGDANGLFPFEIPACN
jgi:hypothetical protein